MAHCISSGDDDDDDDVNDDDGELVPSSVVESTPRSSVNFILLASINRSFPPIEIEEKLSGEQNSSTCCWGGVSLSADLWHQHQFGAITNVCVIAL